MNIPRFRFFKNGNFSVFRSQ